MCNCLPKNLLKPGGEFFFSLWKNIIPVSAGSVSVGCAEAQGLGMLVQGADQDQSQG